jgi:hypothetical protein
MNIKYVSLLSLLYATAMMSAVSNNSFSGKTLEELEAIYTEQMKDVENTREFKQLEAILGSHSKKQAVLGKTKLKCSLFRDNSYAVYAMGASQKDCDLLVENEKEYHQSEMLKKYAERQLDSAKNPELRELEEHLFAQRALRILEESDLK